MNQFNNSNSASNNPEINTITHEGGSGYDGNNCGSGNDFTLTTLSDIANSLDQVNSDNSIVNLLNISGNVNSHFANNILNMAAMMTVSDDIDCGIAINSLSNFESDGMFFLLIIKLLLLLLLLYC